MSESDKCTEMSANNGEHQENADSEPEAEDEEKEAEGECGRVEVPDTEREKATDLDFQHCKIPRYFTDSNRNY